jgi:peptidoglycan/xylan/chitin deacetylase (PgdA/CDA1 family)
MRFVVKFSLALAVSLMALSGAQAQKTTMNMAAAEPSATEAKAPAPRVAAPTCANPKALGVSRTVEIDTTGGPGFGFEHFKAYDFLRNKEVVLTFDDGPWPHNTPIILKALADECVQATFFPIGKHALWHPEILKQVYAAGHTIGTHTWSHKDLSRKPYDDIEKAKEEIEMGASAVAHALGRPGAPFFRFPALRHPPELVKYLGSRNIGIFSTDMDSFDFKMRKSAQVVRSVMRKLDKHGKGIVLMHDFQRPTAEAIVDLLQELKKGGYKIVHMRAARPIKTVAKYDAELLKQKDIGLATVTSRPLSSVVRTINKGN